MKKVTYKLPFGAKMLNITSIILLVIGIISAFVFLILFFDSKDYDEYNWIYMVCLVMSLLFSSLYFGICQCVAYITETKAIKQALLLEELKEKEIVICLYEEPKIS